MKRDGKSKFKNTIKVSLSDQYGSCTITSESFVFNRFKCKFFFDKI